MAQREPEGLLEEDKPRRARVLRVMSLAKLSATGVVCAAVVLAVAGVLVYQIYAATAQRLLEQRVQTLTSEVAYALAIAIQTSAAEVDRTAVDPQVIQALAGGDPVQIANTELRLSKRFHGALRVRLLRPGAMGAEVGAFPRLGYADLDMVHMAEASGDSPLVEAHLFGTEEAHIDMMRPVRGDGGSGVNQLLGHLLVSFSADMVRNAIDKVSVPVGYLEVRQRTDEQGGTVTLAARGEAALAHGATSRVANLPGTRWELVFATSPAETSAAGWRTNLIWCVFAGTLILLSLIGYGFFRVLQRAVQSDLETLIDVVRDARVGKPPQAEYPLHLEDFRGTVDVLSAAAHHPLETPPAVRAPAKTGRAAPQFTADQLPMEVFNSEPVHASPTESTVNLPISIFRAYDIRGVVGQTLTGGNCL